MVALTPTQAQALGLATAQTSTQAARPAPVNTAPHNTAPAPTAPAPVAAANASPTTGGTVMTPQGGVSTANVAAYVASHPGSVPVNGGGSSGASYNPSTGTLTSASGQKSSVAPSLVPAGTAITGPSTNSAAKASEAAPAQNTGAPTVAQALGLPTPPVSLYLTPNASQNALPKGNAVSPTIAPAADGSFIGSPILTSINAALGFGNANAASIPMLISPEGSSAAAAKDNIVANTVLGAETGAAGGAVHPVNVTSTANGYIISLTSNSPAAIKSFQQAVSDTQQQSGVSIQYLADGSVKITNATLPGQTGAGLYISANPVQASSQGSPAQNGPLGALLAFAGTVQNDLSSFGAGLFGGSKAPSGQTLPAVSGTTITSSDTTPQVLAKLGMAQSQANAQYGTSTLTTGAGTQGRISPIIANLMPGVAAPFSLFGNAPAQPIVSPYQTIGQNESPTIALAKINAAAQQANAQYGGKSTLTSGTSVAGLTALTVTTPGNAPITTYTGLPTNPLFLGMGLSLGTNPQPGQTVVYFSNTSNFGNALHDQLTSQYDTSNVVGEVNGTPYLMVNGTAMQSGAVQTNDTQMINILKSSGASYNATSNSWNLDAMSSNAAANEILANANDAISSQVVKVGKDYYPINAQTGLPQTSGSFAFSSDSSDVKLATSNGGTIVQPIKSSIVQQGSITQPQVYLPWDKAPKNAISVPFLPFLKVSIENVPVNVGQTTIGGVKAAGGPTESQQLAEAQARINAQQQENAYNLGVNVANTLGIKGTPANITGGATELPYEGAAFVGSLINPAQAKLFVTQAQALGLSSPETQSSFAAYATPPAILAGAIAAGPVVGSLVGGGATLLGASAAESAGAGSVASGLTGRALALYFTAENIIQSGQITNRGVPTGQFSLAKGIGASLPLIGFSAADISGVKYGSVDIKTQTELGELTPLKNDLAKLATDNGGYIGGQTAVELQQPLNSVRSGVDVDIYLKGADAKTVGADEAKKIDQENVANVANKALDIAKTNYEKIGLDPNSLELEKATSHIKVVDKATGKDVADVGIRNQPGDKIVSVNGINARYYNQILADKRAIVNNVAPTEAKAVKAAADIAQIEASEDITKVPTTTIYRGLYRGPSSGSLLKAAAGISGEGAANPLIGIGENGNIIVGTPSDFALSFPSLENAWLPTQSFDTRNAETYPRGTLEMSILGNPKALELRGATPADIENKFLPISELSLGLKDQVSKFVSDDFASETKVYGPNAVKFILDTLKEDPSATEIDVILGGKQKAKLGGSFFTMPQVKPEYQRIAGDFDATESSEAAAIKLQTTLIEGLKKIKDEGFGPYNPTPEPGGYGVLDNAKDTGETTMAVNIHAKGEEPGTLGSTTSGPNANMRYGVNVNRAPYSMKTTGRTFTLVEGQGNLPFSQPPPSITLPGDTFRVEAAGEQTVRKLTATGTFYKTPTEEFVIEPGRAKDVTDAYALSRTLIDSAKESGKNTVKLEQALDKYRNAQWRTPGIAEAYSELDKGVANYLAGNPVKLDITNVVKPEATTPAAAQNVIFPTRVVESSPPSVIVSGGVIGSIPIGSVSSTSPGILKLSISPSPKTSAASIKVLSISTGISSIMASSPSISAPSGVSPSTSVSLSKSMELSPSVSPSPADSSQVGSGQSPPSPPPPYIGSSPPPPYIPSPPSPYEGSSPPPPYSPSSPSPYNGGYPYSPGGGIPLGIPLSIGLVGPELQYPITPLGIERKRGSATFLSDIKSITIAQLAGIQHPTSQLTAKTLAPYQPFGRVPTLEELEGKVHYSPAAALRIKYRPVNGYAQAVGRSASPLRSFAPARPAAQAKVPQRKQSAFKPGRWKGLQVHPFR